MLTFHARNVTTLKLCTLGLIQADMVLQWYHRMATKHPLAVNATMGFIVGTMGDLACQKYIYKRSDSEGYNMQQAFEMGITRMIVISPFLHVYYPWLDRICPGKAPQRVIGRVILDQLIGSPIVICSVMTVTCIFRGKGMVQIYEQVRENAFDAWTMGLQYWPFIHTLNFGFVPVVHQPLVAGFGSVYWYAMLSYYSSKDKECDKGVNGDILSMKSVVDSDRCKSNSNSDRNSNSNGDSKRGSCNNVGNKDTIKINPMTEK